MQALCLDLHMMCHSLPTNTHDAQGIWGTREAANERVSGQERTLLSGIIKAVFKKEAASGLVLGG